MTRWASPVSGLACGAIAAAAFTLAALTGCQPPRAEEGGFDSANPASKLYAISEAGRTRNPDAVPDLIAQLDSDDPAVRMYAIVALEKITGERKGYSPYAPPHARSAAVERWVAAYARQRPGDEDEPADPATNARTDPMGKRDQRHAGP